MKTWAVIWSVMACWTAGSEASGVTVATYRSVSVTWLRVQMATTDSGASTQATTIMRVATIVRQRWRPTRLAPWVGSASAPLAACSWRRTWARRVAFSARSRSSSARSSAVRVGFSDMGATVLVFASRLCAVTAASPNTGAPASPEAGDFAGGIIPSGVIPPTQGAARIEPTAAGGERDRC